MPLYSCKQILSILLHLWRCLFFPLCHLPGCSGLRPVFPAGSYSYTMTLVIRVNPLSPERAGRWQAEPCDTLRAASPLLPGGERVFHRIPAWQRMEGTSVGPPAPAMYRAVGPNIICTVPSVNLSDPLLSPPPLHPPLPGDVVPRVPAGSVAPGWPRGEMAAARGDRTAAALASAYSGSGTAFCTEGGDLPWNLAVPSQCSASRAWARAQRGPRASGTWGCEKALSPSLGLCPGSVGGHGGAKGRRDVV